MTPMTASRDLRESDPADAEFGSAAYMRTVSRAADSGMALITLVMVLGTILVLTVVITFFVTRSFSWHILAPTFAAACMIAVIYTCTHLEKPMALLEKMAGKVMSYKSSVTSTLCGIVFAIGLSIVFLDKVLLPLTEVFPAPLLLGTLLAAAIMIFGFKWSRNTS